MDLLAATAPTLAQAMAGIARLAYAILDGTLTRTDRLTGPEDRRHYAGKHHCHGVNTQVIADPAGRLMSLRPGRKPPAASDPCTIIDRIAVPTMSPGASASRSAQATAETWCLRHPGLPTARPQPEAQHRQKPASRLGSASGGVAVEVGAAGTGTGQ